MLKILSTISYVMYWLYTYNHLIHPSFWWINKDNQIVKLNNMFQRFKTKPTNFCPWKTATYVEISFCYFFNSIAKLYLIVIFYESHSCQLFQARIIFSHLIQKKIPNKHAHAFLENSSLIVYTIRRSFQDKTDTMDPKRTINPNRSTICDNLW